MEEEFFLLKLADFEEMAKDIIRVTNDSTTKRYTNKLIEEIKGTVKAFRGE